MEYIAKSYAKINAGLIIPFKYPNGYHHLITRILPISLHDTITVRLEPDEGNNFQLNWKNELPQPFAGEAPQYFDHPEKNILYEAREWFIHFLERYRKTDYANFIRNTTTEISITKRIPSPSGLGGGSSNAATLLKILFYWLEDTIGQERECRELKEIMNTEVLELGADIPFFITHKDSLISGIGEVLRTYSSPGFVGILGIPPFGLSTARMFKALQKPVGPTSNSPFPEAKKSLHDSNGVGFYLSEAQDMFDTLFELGHGEKDPGHPLLTEEESQVYTIKNEFLTVLEEIDPAKKNQIDHLRHEAANHLKNHGLPVFSSLSGSGGSFYAGTIMVARGTGKELADNGVRQLRAAYPEVYWTSFESFKENWAVAKR